MGGIGSIAQRGAHVGGVILHASRRRPAVAAATLLMAGIALHRALPHRPGAWLMLIAGLTLGAIVARKRDGLANACLGMAILLVGMTGAQLAAYYFPKDHIGLLADEEGRICDVEMVIEEPPRIVTGAATGARPLPPRQVSQARVTAVRMREGWRSACGDVQFQINEIHPRLAAGQRVRVLGRLERPAGAMNEGQFDWQAYYRDRRILASVTARHAGNVETVADEGPGVLTVLRQKARALLALGFDGRRALDHALLRALVLGDTDPQLRDVQQDFIRTGTSHHLAISGMHVAILGMCIYFLCRLVMLSPRTSAWVLVGFVIFYGEMALPSPPVVRSVLLCVFLAVGIVLRRVVDAVQLLALAVAAMLIYQPLDLYNAGFELSFGTVLGMMLFSKKVREAIERRKTRDELLMEGMDARTWRARTVAWIKSWCFEAVSTGVVAWLVSAPLIATHFDQLNPYAMPASILLGIPVLMSLVGGFLKIALTLLLPSFAGTWATLAAWPVALMRHGVDWLARIPGSDVAMPAPPVWLIIVYYALLVLPFLPAARPWLRGLARCGPVAAGAMALLLPVLIGFGSAGPRGDTRLTLLALGAGQCGVLELPDGRVMLFDAGSDTVSDVGTRIIAPYLRRRGHNRIDAVFLSHPDTDHTNAVAALGAMYDIGAIYVSPYFAEHCRRDPVAQAMYQRLAELSGAVEMLSPGDVLALDGQTRARVVAPGSDRLKRNDASMVVQLSCRGHTILLTGDILAAGERELLADPAAVKSEILVAPHHGSLEATTGDLLAAVDPAVVLCSNKRGLTRKQTQFDALAAGRELYRTDRRGAVTVVIGKNGRREVRTFR